MYKIPNSELINSEWEQAKGPHPVMAEKEEKFEDKNESRHLNCIMGDVGTPQTGPARTQQDNEEGT
jgi:hypothetical protein